MAANLAAFAQLWDFNPTFATYVPCTTQLLHAWHMSPAHSKLCGQQTSVRANENAFRLRRAKPPDSRGLPDHPLLQTKTL